MKTLLLLFALVIVIGVNAQTGPGGVGKTDGTSDLVLWLDANVSSATNSLWPDKSGNGFTMNDGSGAILNTNVQNGNSVYSFDGSTRYFQRAYEPTLNPNTFTIFCADKVLSSSKYKAVIASRDDPDGVPTAGYILYAEPTSNNWQFWTGDQTGTGGSYGWGVTNSNISTENSWSSQTMEYQNVSNGKKIYINGENKAENTHPYTANPNRPIRIGASQNEGAPNFYFNGDIGEIIMYNTVLNSVQRIIVQNYLSAKWGYAMSANDKYAGDDVAKGDYDLHVIGIGQEIDGVQSKSSDNRGLILEIQSGAVNGDYLFAGSMVGDNGINTSDVTGVNNLQARWERVWYFDRTVGSGSTIAVNIYFDFADGGFGTQNPNASATANYRLLYRAGNTGSWTDLGGASSVSGAEVIFANNTLTYGDGYYTIGSLDTLTAPLPIELLSFEVNKNDNNVVLEWQTATETNNNYFTVERSANAQEWEAIAQIKGAGNSNELLSYTIVDNKPINGINYYRLKQTDFDGNYSYSSIRRVQLASKEIRIYPNPTQNTISIEGIDATVQNIRIYNVIGAEVGRDIPTVQKQGDRLVLDLSSMPTGVYFITIEGRTFKVFKQ